MDNPIELLDRGKVQEYANAEPMAKEQVMRKLGQIDKSVLAGKRDYAMILIMISTGRRSSEILALQWKDVYIEDDTVTLHFEHCKGGIKMREQIGAKSS